METETLILDHEAITARLNRLAWQICENHHSDGTIVMAGISGNGKIMAERLSKLVADIGGPEVSLVNISLDKDDPISSGVSSDAQSDTWKGKTVVVVDDVLNSGRTLIYAVKFFLDNPVKKIRTVVLLDRSHRSFPVKADYVGMTLATTLQEHIRVEFGERDRAYLV